MAQPKFGCVAMLERAEGKCGSVGSGSAPQQRRQLPRCAVAAPLRASCRYLPAPDAPRRASLRHPERRGPP